MKPRAADGLNCLFTRNRRWAERMLKGEAWKRDQPARVHGWVYDLNVGLPRALHCTMASVSELPVQHPAAVTHLHQSRLRETAASSSG